MSDFNLTRASYYTDFAVVPAMLGLALAGAWIGGLTYVFVAMALAGYGGWTLFEYAMHRYAFHRFYRREHWLHHLRPRANIGVPARYTVPAILFLWAGMVGSAGVQWGGGAYFGGLGGYLTYLVTHHWIHRWPIPAGHWLAAARDRHDLHHAGVEANFNVLWPVWDRRFGTYRQPRG